MQLAMIIQSCRTPLSLKSIHAQCEEITQACFEPSAIHAFLLQDGLGMEIVEIEVVGQSLKNNDIVMTSSPHAMIVPKSWCGSFVLPSSAFTPDIVGAKALNLLRLRVSWQSIIIQMQNLSDT